MRDHDGSGAIGSLAFAKAMFGRMAGRGRSAPIAGRGFLGRLARGGRAGRGGSAQIEGRGSLGGRGRDTRGNPQPIIGGALVPRAGMIGSGGHMGGAYMAKNRLQSACDAAALAGRRVMQNDTLDSN